MSVRVKDRVRVRVRLRLRLRLRVQDRVQIEDQYLRLLPIEGVLFLLFFGSLRFALAYDLKVYGQG